MFGGMAPGSQERIDRHSGYVVLQPDSALAPQKPVPVAAVYTKSDLMIHSTLNSMQVCQKSQRSVLADKANLQRSTSIRS